MAIADYDSLVAAIKRYCARSDTTFNAAIPVFVGLAEERLYNGHGEPTMPDPLFSAPIRSSVMEAEGTITLTDGEGPIPADYLFMRKVMRAGDSGGLRYLAPERFDTTAVVYTSGTPLWYTITGSTLAVVPSWAGDLSILYYKRHPAITSSNTTGPMIAAHGLAYLEAALIEAFSFLQEGEAAAGHAAKLRGIVAGINRSATELRYSGPLRVRQRVAIP